MNPTTPANYDVVALYEQHQNAQEAVEKLLSAGIPKDEISILMNEQATHVKELRHSHDTSVISHVFAGGGIGGVSGLALGLMALAGGLAGAGPLALALALSGTGVGVIGGGIVGTMNHMGVPDEHANLYEEAVLRGAVLVVVHGTPAEDTLAAEVLRGAGALQVDAHATQQRGPGWQEVASPASPEVEHPKPIPTVGEGTN